MGKAKNFLDFMLELDEPLSRGFIETNTKSKLKEFFKKNGYTIGPNDFEKIWKLKETRDLKSWPPPPHY